MNLTKIFHAMSCFHKGEIPFFVQPTFRSTLLYQFIIESVTAHYYGDVMQRSIPSKTMRLILTIKKKLKM